MQTEFFTFGEMLWDCLPNGRHAGGAPFNVAAHLAQLGSSAALLSSVGRDSLGDELLQIARDKTIDTRFVARLENPDLPTGMVQVQLDANGNAQYDIVQPVAWDEVTVSDEAWEQIAQSRALVFGSLAARSPHNRAQLDELLDLDGPFLKCFDVNFRPPFVDPELVMSLAQRADVIKLNDDELGQITNWLQTGELRPQTFDDDTTLVHACAQLAQATEAPCLCITRGASGALLWENGSVVTATAPVATVRDTIGAGDAFMAGLVVGLTQNGDPQTVLENACRLGAFVAGRDGATPPLPQEIIDMVNK